jgi:CubicO group peptidase (beta-lactamase class C family)
MKILLCVFAFVLAVAAQPAPRQAAVDKIFAGFNTHTPGCAVGVAQNGQVVLEAGYGMADLERGVAVGPDTVFESGSVAKQFTAAALILLAQQGKISLDDPMRKYLPELADYGAPLTIRQVLSHTSGIREWRPIATFGGTPEGTFVYSNEDLLKMAAMQKALNFDPGTAYSYSNTGYNISTILIERVLGGGKTFQQYTQEQIFGPLGMRHTKWRDNFRMVVPKRALAYGRVGGEWMGQTPIENIIGAGGLLTTVGDLLLWNENLKHARVGGAQMVQTQQTTATLAGGRKINYAAGLTVSETDGLREVSHSGATGGYRTWLGRYPEKDLAVAVMCNSAQANAVALGHETARVWTGTKATAPAVAYAAPAADLAALTGLYRKVRDNTVFSVELRGGKLYFGSALEMIPLAPGRFRMGAAEGLVEGGSRIRVSSATGDVLYEKVEAWKPTVADLNALNGNYSSTETGTTLHLALVAGELSYQIGKEPKRVKLRPTFRDTFETPTGASVRFYRDTAGRLTELSVGEDRVWDLRFKRAL